MTALLLAGCVDSQPNQSADSGLPPEVVLRLNNQGVGLMGYFDYTQAAQTFEQVTQQAPAWLDGRANLAIAVLNRQQPGDEDLALNLAAEILAEDNAHLRAHYISGILYFNRGEVENAARHFQAVVDGDPMDAYARYYLGQCQVQLGEMQSGAEHFEQAIALDSYLRSAYYGAFLAYQRLGRRDEARQWLTDYQALEKNPRSRLAEIKYTRMGPKAEAIAFRNTDSSKPDKGLSKPEGQLFAAPVSIADSSSRNPSTVTTWTDSSGRSLIYFGYADEPGRLLSLPDQQWLSQEQWPFLAARGVTSAAWGDFDNDGKTDVYLGRSGSNQLWQNTGDDWIDVTEAAGVAGGSLNSVDVKFVDADHDGDLDIFVINNDGANELFNNNLDGSFRPLAESQELQGQTADQRLLAADIDQDRDLDLISYSSASPPTTYLNDRIWRYSQTEFFPADLTAKAIAAADLDVDGQLEFYFLTAQNALVQVVRSADQWQRDELISNPTVEAEDIWVADFNGNGQPELLLVGKDQWALVDPIKRQTIENGEGRVLSVISSPAANGPQLLIQSDDGLELLPDGPGRHPFLALAFSGKEDVGQSMRSNHSGLGVRYIARSGDQWVSGFTVPQSPGGDLQPVSFGLNGQDKLDYLEIDWSDGVFQTEPDLAAGSLHHIQETQRQLASCPVIFSWDGNQFTFVSDVLGVGGIGFSIAPGEYATPRPWEHFRLEADQLQPDDGLLRIKIAEPMEEIAYIDQAELTAIDIPTGWDFILDERLATAQPAATGDLLWYQKMIPVTKAVNQDNQNVKAQLAMQDLEAAPPGELDPRFLGLLAEEQSLTLNFDQSPNQVSNPALVINGWVEYGYSQTSFAAWQAGRSYDAASLDLLIDNQWIEYRPSFGYPAGMPRKAVLPLTDLPDNVSALRLRTHQQVYWDQIALIDVQSPPEHRRSWRPLHQASVATIGFPKRTTGPQWQPHYDYSDRAPYWDTKYPSGYYTALGPATELVEKEDGGLAIIGPGDALELAFEADQTPLKPGWIRAYVLSLRGWAKDMDLYTENGETVGPLPGNPKDPEHVQRLHQRYNTRYLSGR